METGFQMDIEPPTPNATNVIFHAHFPACPHAEGYKVTINMLVHSPQVGYNKSLVHQFHAGGANAQCFIGSELHKVADLPSKRVAVEVVRLAANQGHAQAQCFLASCYSRGDGVKKDMIEAVKFLHLSADNTACKPPYEAQYQLAIWYATQRQLAKCYFYYLKALNNGYQPQGAVEERMYEKVMQSFALVALAPPVQRCDVCEDVCDPWFCAACGVAKYCSSKCQALDWRRPEGGGGHRSSCTKAFLHLKPITCLTPPTTPTPTASNSASNSASTP
jgi:TPR repeat protein